MPHPIIRIHYYVNQCGFNVTKKRFNIISQKKGIQISVKTLSPSVCTHKKGCSISRSECNRIVK